MKDNQFNQDSDQEYAPMDEYTLIDPEEGAEVLNLKKSLQAQVEELLYLHPEFNDENVRVIESDNVVTLMGSVTSPLDKNLAESLVLELEEVENVINLLEIDGHEAWMKKPDAENFTKGLY